MYGWTEFDLVKMEQGFKEKRLHESAMMPKPAPRQTIRLALASKLVALAQQISPKQTAAPTTERLVMGTEH
jgi:hypothetical protein